MNLKTYLLTTIFISILFCLNLNIVKGDDQLLGTTPKQPPCPEGSGFIPPEWLGEGVNKTGCVWLQVPQHLRAELPNPPLKCFLDETLQEFEVWSNCSPYIENSCPANCFNLEIIDGVATSPPSLAARGAPLVGSNYFGPIKNFATNQRVINQVIASCGFEGEYHYSQQLPMPTPTPAPTPGPDELGCDIVTDFVDGPGGALWKPFSDNTRRPVILLPESYWSGESSFVMGEVLEQSTGNSLAIVTRRTCCPNGGRSHFDVSVSALELDKSNPIIVRLLLSNGTTECRKVPVASKRFD